MGIMKDSWFLTLSKSIKSIVVMVVTIVAARAMTQNDYGTYKQLLLITNFLFGIISAGLATSVSFYYKNLSDEKQKALIVNSSLLSLAISLIPALMLIALRGLIASQFNNQQLSVYIPAMAGYFFILNFLSFLDNLFVADDRSKTLSIVNIVYAFFYCMLTGFIIFLRRGMIEIFIWMFVVELLRTLSLLLLHRQSHQIKVKTSIDWSFLREQFVYCIPLGLTFLFQSLNVYLDKFLVSSYFTPKIFGIYSNGTAEIPFVAWFTFSITTVALPTFSRYYHTDHDPGKMFDLWGKLTKNTAVMLFPIFWVLLFYSQGYISLLYSEAFLPSVLVFMIYLLKLPFACTVFSNILIVMDKKKYILYNMIAGVIMNVALNLVLIKYYGILGATSAAVITQLILIILQLIQISRFSGIGISKLLPYLELFQMLLVSGLVGAGVFILSKVMNFGSIGNLFCYGAITFTLSILAYALMKVSAVEDVFKVFRNKLFKTA